MSYEMSIKYLGASKELPLINYLRCCPYPKPTQALLSIRPEFAFSILSGEKRFEFRRKIFRRSIDVIVIYASAPVQQVIGEFDVKGILQDHPSKLWKKTSGAAGIDKERFYRYFEGLASGYAIEIGGVRLYEEPLCLTDHFGIRPPQSFVYLDFSWPLSHTLSSQPW